jgi:hypothetical protein
MNLNRAKKINRLAASTVFYDDSFITIPTLRVLNQDGSIVDGGGTDKGLTRDHKPEDPEERARIEVPRKDYEMYSYYSEILI